MPASTLSSAAIHMDRYGPPEVLQRICGLPTEPAAGEVRIRTIAAGVNHTDVEIRSGAWPIRKASPFPYVPGIEVVGLVEAVASDVTGWTVGQTVITMMQGLGGVRAERPGGYAAHVTVAADALAALPPGVDPMAMAALGLPAVTAWHGLRKLGDLRDRNVLVTGAAGGVGSAAVALAAAQGARVTGVVARSGQAAYVKRLGAKVVIVAERDRPASIPPASQDGVLDTVGGVLFRTCAAALRPNGVLCLVGAVGGGQVAFDAWGLILPTTLTGYSSETLTGPDLRRAVADLSAALLDGAIRPPRYETLPLSRAADAHRRLEAGGVTGRLLLTPDADEA